MTLAVLCSGQGWQGPAMFALTGDAPEAAPLFAHASRLLDDRDPRDLVRTSPAEALHGNRIGQLLCTVQALAAAAALTRARLHRVVVAGYSVGEVAAWGVADAFSAGDTLDLVARRAQVMDANATRGDGMLFVRGLTRSRIDALCARHDAAIAIFEPDDAFLLGGNRDALGALADEARTMGATHVVEVPVGVASHTRRLGKASAELRAILRTASATIPPTSGNRLLSGIDGLPVLTADSGLDKLAAQLTHPVRWDACLQGCIEAGATAFLELGPGSALSRMAASVARGVPARSLDEFRTMQGARDWVARNA